LGGSNSSYYSGELNYFNVTPPYDQWQIKIDEFVRIINVSLETNLLTQIFSFRISTPGLILCQNCQAILSTSFSYIAGPADVLEQFRLKIGAINSGKYQVVPCESISTLPSKLNLQKLSKICESKK
jgi:hypothetical protein